MSPTLRILLLLVTLATALALFGSPSGTLAAASAPAPAFDVEAATQAYLDSVPAEQRAKSDAYFEGGYWLQLWDFLLAAAINLALLATGLSRRMRDLAERLTRFRPVQTFAYWVQYLVVVTAVAFPMTVYEAFWREHQYGLSNQTFVAWLGDQGMGFVVNLLLGGLLVTALYGVVRRLPRTWALWGAATAIAFIVFTALIGPVYLAPLFNKHERLEDPVVAGSIMSMARAQSVTVDDVWMFDASRQTKRISANVSGFGHTMRISLNDNLLNRSSMAEIEPVMGHEIGHYVLNHVYKSILFFGVIIVIAFAVLRWGFERVVAGRGAAWGIRGPGDVAGFPLALVIVSAYSFAMTPVVNSHIRVAEAEADLFGINASGQPDGEALVDLKLGEYRKLDPGPIEEMLLFDHPSGRSRIRMAMRWKAEHLAEAEANARRAAEIDRQRGWSAQSAEEWARQHEPQ